MARGSDTTTNLSDAALVVAHPGHELRVHGWLCAARPQVFVLTDGSGRAGRPRLTSTRRVLAEAGASPGGLFGRLTDADIYRAILRHELSLFVELAEELADAFRRAGVRYVAADALEGYNPAHDVCRWVTHAASGLASGDGGGVLDYEFAVVGPPGTDSDPATIKLKLTDIELERKLRAARGYAELHDEVEAALAKYGTEAFRIESLRPASAGTDPSLSMTVPPTYERFGEERVADGRYATVLRFEDHMRPIARALAERLHYATDGPTDGSADHR